MKPGDRIELTHMPNDPDPIPTGSTGTVEKVTDFGPWQQVTVDWDNGRSLHLCVPPDKVRILTCPPPNDFSKT